MDLTPLVCSVVLFAAAPDFDREIAPLLAQRCLSCHSSDGPKGNLDLTSRQLAIKGGDSGAALNLEQPLKSPLWQRIVAEEMPPKHPLNAGERDLIQRWLTAGAPWNDGAIDPLKYSSTERAGYDWWSLQPLQSIRPPGNGGHPIDAFLEAQRQAARLTASPPATRSVLLRRLSYDLLGLPPSPADLENFSAETAPGAVERIVDRLLASPHYGERWARHWLDVVRFGESNGFERDLPRPDAWHYREWVVEALNDDLPYDVFVRRQLAADVMQPDDPASYKAVGFLVAGPHDTVVPVVDRMRQSMRQDEMEDLIGTIGQTFLGLTVNCARCHDHKFDPVSSREYYQWVAAFAGVNHGEKEVIAPAIAAGIQQTAARVDQLRSELQRLDASARAAALKVKSAADTVAAPNPIAAWDFTRELRDQIGGLHGSWTGTASTTAAGIVIADGAYVATVPLAKPLTAKTLEARVKLADLEQRGGGVITLQTREGSRFDSIVFGEQEARRWLAGSNFFERTQSFNGPAEDAAHTEFVTIAIVYSADGTITAYRNGQQYGQPYQRPGPLTFPTGEANLLFGLRHAPAGGNRGLKGTIAGARLYDRALTPDEVAQSARAGTLFVTEAELVAQLTADQQRQRRDWQRELAAGQAELDHMKKTGPIKMYTVAATMQPPPAYVLRRGNVADQGDLVAAGGLGAIKSLSADWGLKTDALDGMRRQRFAEWLTSRENPLFARVMVNRLWHYHFGAGLLETPNDFGFNGGKPTHPELLDWLAAEFQRSNFSLKHMHRLIVTSAAYQQASTARPDALKTDANNRWLWRMSPRRLDAETIRDAMLVATGTLSDEVGGKGYSDVNSYFFKGTQFYEPLDPLGAAGQRRTLYRSWARGGRSPFLDTFDCPDPSTTTPKRTVTTTPLQALTLMNHAFVLRMAEALAARLEREAGSQPADRIELAYRLLYGRRPRPNEITLCTTFAQTQGWPTLCRGLLNTSEFLYVD